MSSLSDVDEWPELELRGEFTTNEIVAQMRSAEREKTLASCCVAADAAVLEEFKRRYSVNVAVHDDVLDPDLQSPEDAVVTIRPAAGYRVGKNGLAMVPLDIRLYALPVA